ncbi:HtrA protease/chaperone protein [Rhodopirellula islandica]|uniref:HtrA protease/chaperone protein n=1 Tax=Rhodopirellula islandica TaxID=595434 RepID=A0A0J1EQC3_RHOIS|nr:PA14 domain-containing protein [Rhodopirellula islandica]KLU07684.1 HtrA protease/chaperone protein [Rhodopirellula islandica]
MRLSWIVLSALVTLPLPGQLVSADEPVRLDPRSPRWSPLVDVIAKVEPAVVGLFLEGEEPGHFNTGSGTIIHSSGYVLTNDHVLSSDEGYVVLGKMAGRFEVVARLPEKDIAIVRILHVKGRLPVVPLGHSNDVHNGEAVVVAGNPGGRGITITSGIISSKKTYLDMPNALVATKYNLLARDDYLRFDAASNRGNSGGPLVNMEGKIIGIVSRVNPDEQNASFAIPIDRVRKLIGRIVEPELRHDRWVGMTLNPLAEAALVASVEKESPAEVAGILAGDVIESVGGARVRNAAQWTLALDQVLRESEEVEVLASRNGSALPISIQTVPVPALEGVQLDDQEPGLDYRMYLGKFKKLPDFEAMEVARVGQVDALDLEAIQGDQRDDFALIMDAMIHVPEDGLYRFEITSDDGSRVFLHDQLLLDHDGNHPPMTVSRLVRANAGLHPIRIEYFEGGGDQTLTAGLTRVDASEGDSSEELDSQAEAMPLDLQFFRVPVPEPTAEPTSDAASE